MTALNDLDELLPHLRLLGTTELHVRGQVLRHFGGRSGALLLAQLALAPRKAHPRETLIDQLWPDADIDAGRNRLRNALSVLRASLAEAGCEQIVLADRDSLRLAPGALVCDVHRFEEAVQRQQWLDARHTYAGELLPGHYEEWVAEERHRLAALAERIPAQLPVLGPAEQRAMSLLDRAALLARRGAPEFEARAIELLEQAVDEAPGFALAHTRLAATLYNRALRLVGAERRAQFERARQEVSQAVQLDPSDPRARAMWLVYRYRHELDFVQTRDALLALAERFPDSPVPMNALGIVYTDVGHADEAEACQRRAHRQEPLSVIGLYNIGAARMNGYRYAAALAAFDQVLELEPGHSVSQVGRFFALAGLNLLDEAWAQAQQAVRSGAIGADELGFYAALCAHWGGRNDEARRLYAEPETAALCEREPAYAVLRDVHLGRAEEALARVRQMHADGDPSLLVVFGSRNGLDTRADPRIDAIARALGWRPVDEMLAKAASAPPAEPM
jgi:tetratricopeptide (TPR) repeat protein